MKTVKRLLPQMVALLLVCTFYVSCEPKPKDKATDNPEEEQEEPPIVERPDNIISLDEADVIYDNYSQHRVALIEPYENKKRSPEEKFEAARFVDFDYDTVKQYIAYVDQEAKKAGVKKVTKLRLYFANYPEDKTFPDKKEVVHPRQNSIFMIPTLDSDGINYGFYIGPNGEASLIKDWKPENGKGMGLLDEKPQKAFAGFSLNSSLQGDGSLTLNFGHGGPPPKSDF